MDVKKLAELFQSIGRKKDWRFQLRGKALTVEEVFSFNGLLPAMAKRADQLSLLCLGYGIGVSFEDSDASILGYQLQLNEGGSDIVRLACIYDVVNEMAKSSSTGKIVADELLYE
ncbi:type IV secretion protein IcmS [Gammaproteobacteria bacterium]|nr:type IV secretion protein IcmS [Gammaproteobacteria bacterium]